MSEAEEPTLRLTIEGLRWIGDGYESMGEQAVQVDLHSVYEDTGPGGEIHRALWMELRQRAVLAFGAGSIRWEALDFDAPNRPTVADINGVLDRVEHCAQALRALRQLAPEVLPDDDDEGDGPDPEPDPDPVPASRAEQHNP